MVGLESKRGDVRSTIYKNLLFLRMHTNEPELRAEKIFVYTTMRGTGIEIRFQEETLWLSAVQVAQIFGVSEKVAIKNIRNVFRNNELDEEKNIRTLYVAGLKKPMSMYHLDVAVAAGYRMSSKKATHFRVWAKKVTREHLHERFEEQHEKYKAQQASRLRELECAVKLLKSLIDRYHLKRGKAADLLSALEEKADEILEEEKGKMPPQLTSFDGKAPSVYLPRRMYRKGKKFPGNDKS